MHPTPPCVGYTLVNEQIRLSITCFQRCQLEIKRIPNVPNIQSECIPVYILEVPIRQSISHSSSHYLNKSFIIIQRNSQVRIANLPSFFMRKFWHVLLRSCFHILIHIHDVHYSCLNQHWLCSIFMWIGNDLYLWISTDPCNLLGVRSGLLHSASMCLRFCFRSLVLVCSDSGCSCLSQSSEKISIIFS